MTLRTKKFLDYYGGGLIMAVLKPWVWLLGLILHRDHTPEVRGNICFIKMLGGGSLVIAYPALLGLRRRYQSTMFSLITTKGIKPFAETLGVFDRIDVIDESSSFQILKTGIQCLAKNFWVDTVVDLEVYSRLTTALSTLTAARNRIGFYLEAVFWRKRLHTHLIFFNRYSGAYLWYDAIARLLGSEPASIDLCRGLMYERLGVLREHARSLRRIAIGHSCSEFAGERMLNEQQWLAVFQQHLTGEDQTEVLFLGAKADRDLADRIVTVLAKQFTSLHCQNFCGNLSLKESVRLLASCQEFWGVDSALLHYARLLGLNCVSYWGPTDPVTRLRLMQGLNEKVLYRKVPCSPCVHVAEEPPCRGNNLCIQSLFDRTKDYDAIAWLAYGNSKSVPK
jgi:ADP-heptose:LPS heptosyltransferase